MKSNIQFKKKKSDDVSGKEIYEVILEFCYTLDQKKRFGTSHANTSEILLTSPFKCKVTWKYHKSMKNNGFCFDSNDSINGRKVMLI